MSRSRLKIMTWTFRVLKLAGEVCPVCRCSESSKNTDSDVRFRALRTDEAQSRLLPHASSLVPMAASGFARYGS